MDYASSLSLLIFLAMSIGYFIGSLNFSIIIGKIFYNKDPRDHFSKNAGATNSMRIFGKKVALLVLLCDIFKSIIATLIVWFIAKYALDQYLINKITTSQVNGYVSNKFSDYSLVYLTPLFALIGHCFPIYYNFKGGKGAATYAAFLWMISPFIAIISFFVWISIINYKKMVSLSCVITGSISLFFLFLPGLNWFYIMNLPVYSISYINYSFMLILPIFFFQLIGTLLLLYKHKENIIKIINNQERIIAS